MEYPPPPGFGLRQLLVRPPANYGWAVAALVLFWPLSIPAFLSARRVDSAWAAGDRIGAFAASQTARTYGLVGVVVGAVLWLLVLIWLVVILAFVAHTRDVISHVPSLPVPTASLPSVPAPLSG
jgi:hypothetical protein